MEKLITVVITIALGAILLTATTYYGNKAYQDAKAEAYAQQLVTSAQTVATAWQQWSKDNGGATGLTDYDWTDGTYTDLVPNYLPALPKGPTALLDGASCNKTWIPIGVPGTSVTNCISNTSVVNAFGYRMDAVKGKRTCEKITEMSDGKGASVQSLANLNLSFTFYCVYFTSEARYWFVYRVFR